uniref:VAR2CSA n=1 Tax=Meloidogyne hapla TaxID=6305 RepID=A0A1I8B2U4_MELHA
DNIASKCEINRKKICQIEKRIKNKLNLCKEGGPADSTWHGIQIKTDEINNNSIIIGLSVTNKM